MKYVTVLNGEQYELEIEKDGTVLLNGEPRDVDFLQLGPSLYSVIANNKSLQVVIDEQNDTVQVLMGGRMYETQVLDERALMMAMRKGGLSASGGDVDAPMPGLIVAVPVEEGQAVSQGQTVVILESMKMQNELKAPIDGVVTAIRVEAGQSVEKNQSLIVIEPPEE